MDVIGDNIVNKNIINNNISYSMYMDSSKKNLNDISKNNINCKRNLKKWVDDNAVENCFNCNSTFTLFLRKHHCRACGRIFCYHCTLKRISLPKNIENFPDTHKDYKLVSLFNSLLNLNENEVRVCDKCYNKIFQIKKLYNLILVISLTGLDIVNLKKISLVSNIWNKAALIEISKFRELQYLLPDHIFTEYEKNILWINKKYFKGHNCWLIQLLKSIDNNDDKKYNEIITLLDDSNKIIDCWDIMCSRNCQPKISPELAINLLCKDITNCEIRKYAVHYLSKANDDTILCLLPVISFNLRFEKQATLSSFIISRSINSKLIFNDLYWELLIYLEDTEYQDLYSNILDNLIVVGQKKYGNKYIEYISRTKSISHIFMKCDTNLSSSKIKRFISKNIESFDIKKNNIKMPINPNLIGVDLDVSLLEIKNSAIKPILLNFKCINENKGNDDNKFFNYRTLFKKEDLRKDKIVLNIIKIIDLILKNEEGLDLNITHYRVCPIGSNGGFVEIVENAETLYYINKKLNFTIQNYILDKNQDSKILDVKNRFLKSTAAYCVITYLLGIGDRHLDNIMLTDDGCLFNIDFGFILGYDPKPLNIPSMRLTEEMVDAIGGINSENYEYFKKICTQAFNCLRRHYSIFYHMLSLLPDSAPPIIDFKNYTKDRLKNEIYERFMFGHSYEEAELQFNIYIERSYNTNKHAFYDFLHHHNKESTVTNTVQNIYNKASNIANNLINIIN